MKKRLLAIIFALILVCTGLTACGTKGNDDSSEDEGGKTKLTLWSSYTAQSNNKLAILVAKFNAQSEEYELTMEVGQSGSETRQKLAASTPEYYPSLFMGTNNANAEYAASRYTAPIQDFIDKDEDKWTEDILATVKREFSDEDGNLIGLPVGVSVKGYMVNMNFLEQTGYTLDDLTSFEKVAEVAQVAKAKDICKYGYIPSGQGNVTNMLLYQGVDVFDNNNGHDGDVTKCLYGEGETYKALYKYGEIYAGLYRTGAAMKNNGGADGGTSTFVNGQALFWATTSSFVYEFADLELGFEWAFVPFHGVDDNAKYKDMVLAEGTGIYIANTGNEKEMQGAYEFIKFLGSEESQLFWCTFRGYTPYKKSILESSEWIEWRDENHPTEALLEGPLQNESTELRYPNVSVMSRLLASDGEYLSLLSTNPDGDIDAYIKQITKSLQEAVDMDNARK